MEDRVLKTVAEWLGRRVTVSTGADRALGEGVVLAVDDTPYAPSAWVRFWAVTSHPMYRSCDLSDLDDVETGEPGPRWGTGDPATDDERTAVMRAQQERREG